MNSKITLAALMVVLLPLISFAQSCEEIADLTAAAINEQSATLVEEHLSDDFSIAGQSGPIAKLVLGQLLAQFGDKVLSHKVVSKEMIEGQEILTYDFVYEERGSTVTTFIFDKNCKIVELKLFKMEVKTMNSNDSKVDKSTSKRIKIPFQLLGKLIMVKVSLDGVDRNFLLDSGSPKVILNSNYLDQPDSLRKTISSSKGVNGSVSGMDLHRINQLDFHGIQMKDQEVITMDLSKMEKETEDAIHGLIGYEMIKDYDLLYDYEHLELVLIQPEITAAYLADHYPDAEQVVMPLKLEGHIPIVVSEIQNKKIRYGIDCGAETNLLDDDLYESVKGTLRNVEVDTLSGFGSVRKEVRRGDVESTRFGKVMLNDLTTVFSDISHINEGYGMKIDGLIGYEVLSRQPTLISYARKTMTFILK